MHVLHKNKALLINGLGVATKSGDTLESCDTKEI
jgi:hypothetical protein